VNKRFERKWRKIETYWVMPCGDEFASSIGRDGGTVRQSEREIHGVLIAYPDRRSTISRRLLASCWTSKPFQRWHIRWALQRTTDVPKDGTAATEAVEALKQIVD